MASGRKLTLRTSDGVMFEVDEAVAVECQTIKFMVEDGCADGVIPLPKVSSVIFSKIIEYCKKHADHEDQTAAARQWDADFINVDHCTLYGLLMAANFLYIPSLLDLSCQRIADMIKGKTADEIQKTFHIEKDFSPEEEEEIRREFHWVFQ